MIYDVGMNLNSVAMDTIFSPLTQLRSLYAERSGNWNVTKTLSRMPSLTTVILKGTQFSCVDLQDSHFALKVIELQGSPTVDDTTLNILCRYCPNIEELSISDCPVTDTGFVALQNLLHLSRLEAKNLAKVTDLGAKETFSICQRLRIINVEGMKDLSDDGVWPLITGPEANQLWTLNLGYTSITDKTLEVR